MWGADCTDKSSPKVILTQAPSKSSPKLIRAPRQGLTGGYVTHQDESNLVHTNSTWDADVEFVRTKKRPTWSAQNFSRGGPSKFF